MKVFFLFLVCCLLAGTVFGQQKPADFSGFLTYVSDNFRTAQQLRGDCNWHYAVTKVDSDENGKITGYTVLNDASDVLKKGLRFLPGYAFDKSLAVNKRPVVFIINIDTFQEDCDGPFTIPKPTAAINQVFACLDAQYKRDPHTIFLYKTIGGRILSRRQ